MRILSCFVALSILPACSSVEAPVEGPSESVGEAISSTPYVDMTTRLSSADLARWEASREGLVHSFDDVCGDTFCSGDYADLSTIDITCSMNEAGRVRECGWKLGGSIEYVDGATGKFSLDARTFNCRIPVKSKASTFLTALEDSASDIHEPLPGTGESFKDGIGQCLAGVIGDPPPESTGTTYEEIADYFNDHVDPGFWFGVRRRLVEAFDASCPDTYCGTTWSSIVGLRFVCSTNQTTGEVIGCRFNFAAANPAVSENGRVAGKMKILHCPIHLHGQALDVESALQGPDPLHAPLPGSTATIADQLDACL